MRIPERAKSLHQSLNMFTKCTSVKYFANPNNNHDQQSILTPQFYIYIPKSYEESLVLDRGLDGQEHCLFFWITKI